MPPSTTQPMVKPSEPQPPLTLAAKQVIRIELLEGVRGLLACWVMIGHFTLYLGGATLLSNGSHTLLAKAAFLAINGDVPVCLFMILSGFVISNLIESRREPYGGYIARRFMRLFPALVCCFIFGLAVSHWQSSMLPQLPWAPNDPWLINQAGKAFIHRQFALQNILAHIPMVHGLIPPSWWPDASGAFLGPAWSISTEWQFYLIAPLALAAARRLSGLTLLVFAIAVCQVTFSRLRLNGSVDNYYNGAFLGFYIQYFFIGGVSYFIWRALRRAVSTAAAAARPLQGMTLCGAAISFFMLLPVLFGVAFGGINLTPFLPVSILAIWIFLFSGLCQITTYPYGWEATLLHKTIGSHFIVFLGRISYSIYLVHFPVGLALLGFSRSFWTIPRPAFVVSYFIAGSLLTIAAAWVLYHFIEAPGIEWAKRKFARP